MTDQDYMRRAIALAKKGRGWTNPNPMVGAVVVKDGKIIGEGYHPRCGELHAERIALSSCAEDPAGATLYVTLEPCCHYGRTPPCTEIILEKQIDRVVIGSRDPNPKVAGKGARLLREQGVQVEEDFLRKECDDLNPVFFHYITSGQPYVVMKYAMTLDGKIATRTGASRWITGEEARAHVHQLRGYYAAIMVGIGTVLADDPILNCRIPGGHQPVRVICDSQLRIPLDSQICQTAREYPTILACSTPPPHRKQALEAMGITVVTAPSKCEAAFSAKDIPDRPASPGGGSSPNLTGPVDLRVLMQYLGQKGLDSVLIEGGGTLHEAALEAGIVNHVCAYIAPKLFGGCSAKTPVEGNGVAWPAESPKLTNRKITPLGEDILLSYDIKPCS